MNYTKEERLKICTDIAQQLKFYKSKNGAVNLFNDSYSFVKPLKQIFNDYIKNETEFRGFLDFDEIEKKIEYHFPISKNQQPLFVIRIK
jgi:hypothetical protein